MSFRLNSLGLKLNLALLLFFLVVGFATAAVVYFGFSRTRENANTRSREALEELGQQNLQEIANSQADFGAIEMEWAAELGHRASMFMQDFRASGSSSFYDPAWLTRVPNGMWHDLRPERRADLILVPSDTLSPAMLDEIAYTAPLQSLMPALMAGFPGEITADSFHPIAITYVSAQGLGWYYPPRGSVYQTTPPDIRVEDFFTEVDAQHNPERKSVWSPPYQDRAGQGLVITAQTPVYEGDTFRGIFEVDLLIGNLAKTVDLVKPTENGFAFYVDVEGKILRTSAYDLLANELESQDNQGLASLVSRMQVGERGVEPMTLGGNDFFIAFAPVTGVGGGFGVVAPVSELTGEAAAITAGIDHQADQTMTIVLTSMAALFAIALVGATYLNRRVLLRPIEALVAGTRAVAEGDLESKIEVRGDDELAALGHSFNLMTSEILQRADSLRQEVREREAAQEELRALFAAMTDRVIVFDRSGRVVRLPDTNAPDLGIAQEQLPGMALSEIVPGEQAERVLQTIQRALRERVTVTEEFPYMVVGDTYWFSSAFSPISDTEVVMVARDITEVVNARTQIERQVQERTRELQTLLTVSRNVASTLDPGPLLQLIIEQVKEIADYSRCSVFVLDGDSIVLLDSRSVTSNQQVSLRIPLDMIQPLWSPICAGEAVIIDDVRGDSPKAAAYRRASGDLLETAFRNIHSWMGVPLESKDRLIGMLTLSHDEMGFYNEHHASLVTAIATQVAVAIENAQLYEQVQARSQELAALLSVSRNVASTLELRPLLQLIIEQLQEIVDFNRCSIFELEGETMVILDSRASFTDMPLDMRFQVGDLGPIWERMSRGESVVVDDVHDGSVLAQAYRHAAGARMETYPFQAIHAALGVPLTSKDRIIGMLVLTHMQPAYYNERHAGLVSAIATQIAVAIDNARLYEQAQQLAAVEERQRLARELHDSVSQALYGIALGARTARTLLDRDPAKVVEPVEYVLSLAEAGLAEMRALIFELRPESLEIEGLVVALDKQVAATAARYGLEVTSDLIEEPEMSLAQKEIFYRIGQEALHNVVKHARASKASVRLARDNGSFVLEVSDNGVGFEAGQSFPGHMGLVSMSERAQSIGAELEVESAPGKGTKVKLRAAAG